MEKLTARNTLKLLAITGVVISSLALPNVAVAYGALAKQWKQYRKGDVGRIVKRFQKQQLIITREQGDQTILELTDKGRNKLLKYDFDELKPPIKRDGHFRLVIFDIPNTQKIARDIFRLKLKELKFIKLQESVFISAYKCREQVELLAHCLNIFEYVILIEINKIELGPSLTFQPVYKNLLEQ